MSKKITTYGIWRVTTEGDCEGRSTRDLGVFEGYISDIAFHLADRVTYKLTFSEEPSPEKILYVPKKSSVSISFGYGTKLCDLSVDSLKRCMAQDGFKDILVEKGQFYESYKITNTTFDPKEKVRLEAISKLTEEEREALGV